MNIELAYRTILYVHYFIKAYKIIHERTLFVSYKAHANVRLFYCVQYIAHILYTIKYKQ